MQEKSKQNVRQKIGNMKNVGDKVGHSWRIDARVLKLNTFGHNKGDNYNDDNKTNEQVTECLKSMNTTKI